MSNPKDNNSSIINSILIRDTTLILLVSAPLLLIFGFLTVASSNLGSFHYWLSQSDAAAWVQAIGSIGAILIAVYVAQWQTYRTEKNIALQQSKNNLVRLKVLWGFLGGIEDCCHAFRWANRETFLLSAFIERVSRQRTISSRLPIFELPTTEAVEILFKGEEILGQMMEFCERYEELGFKAQERAPGLRSMFVEKLSELKARCLTEIELAEKQHASIALGKLLS